MKYNDNGEYKDIYVKAFDTLPVGTEVDYIGSTVPSGWTQVDSYSTSEVNTGQTWIDGKLIYRKVIETTTALSEGTTTISHGITNFGQVTNWRLTNDRNQTFPRVETDTTNNNWTGISGIDSTNINIRVIGTTWTSRKWIIIIEYTKTTD